MAKVPDGSLKTWNDGDTIDASDYVQEREMLRVAVNDTDARVDGLSTSKANTSDVYTKTQIDDPTRDHKGTWVGHSYSDFYNTSTDMTLYAKLADMNAFTFAKWSVAVGVASQTLTASGVDTAMTLLPQGNNYPLDSGWVTSTWTCPAAGVYEITLNILVNAPTGSVSQAKTYINGTLDQIMDSIPNSTGSTQLVGAGNSDIKKLSQGDTLKVYVSNTAASGASIAGNYSRINIKRIG